MNLQELKQKNPAELISEAEKLGIENPSTLRKQEILFAILKKLAENCGVEKLSMGMSEDFEKAISFGATHVRVGSAIFGDRVKSSEQ